MAVVPRKRKGKTVYGVLTSWGKDKPPHWELVGPNKREAEDLDRKRRKEVRQGTFRPGQVTGESSVSAYAAGWLAKRANRAAAADRSTMRDHALSAEWFSKMPITDVRPKHIIQLIEEIKGRGTMAPKSLTNLMGVLRVMFRDATIAEVIAASPYVVPKGMLSRRGKKRIPYTVDELEALCSDVVGERQQVWNILAFYLGARMGEICGLRWSDWDEGPAPLGSMRIERQYEGRETKTGRLRVVPVHPRLADALKAWRARWSLHYLRRPTPTDFIVPVRADESISRTVAYKCWRKACDVALVTNKTVHSTRHTFITLTQRGGADRRIVELITHNPKEEIIDTYTTRAWSELCEAVLCMPSARASKTPSPSGSPEGNGGSGTSAETPDLQNVPTLPEVGRVRVLESEPKNKPRRGSAYSAASNGSTDAEDFDVALREHPGALPPPEPLARITAETLDEEDASDVG